ncbi:MAG: ABC transporter permease subunit [Bdellovibrionales bacterium]|nr:ABC transporter permease subunit [Bdellovibrionales bacterium]
MIDGANINAICKREFRSYFATPLALIFLCAFLILNGFFTFELGNFFELGEADLGSFFVWHPWLYLFIVPAISMRLWAEERKTGTIELLFTYPVSLFEAMAGKFLAAWAFLGFALLLTLPIVFTAYYLGDPDGGVIVASYCGSFLLAGACLAIGIAVSAATDNQVIAFVISTSICLALTLLGFDPVVQALHKVFPPTVIEQITNLSFPFHFEAIRRGVLDFRDIFYFLSIIGLGLFSGAIVLDKVKAQ